MLYGIEQSTDMRDKRTVIKKFTSQKAALAWAKNSGGYTYADPVGARNHHKTFRYVYDLPNGLRHYIKAVEKCFSYATNTYPVSRSDAEASVIQEYGTEIERKVDTNGTI
jgi:hypothetical protein